jgi:hypothetical protein
MLATLALRRRLTRALAEPFAVVLGLIMGLQVIAWFIFLVQPALSAVSSASVIVAALLFLLAILWDLLLSGDQVTNGASAVFPRETRVLLYLGYMLVSSATLVYLKSVHFVSTGQIVPLGSQSDMLEGFGAIGLGLPLIAYTFVQGLAHWRGAHGRGVHDATPVRPYEGDQRRLHSLAPASAKTTVVLGRDGACTGRSAARVVRARRLWGTRHDTTCRRPDPDNGRPCGNAHRDLTPADSHRDLTRATHSDDWCDHHCRDRNVA